MLLNAVDLVISTLYSSTFCIFLHVRTSVQRLNKMWDSKSDFGLERNAYRIYLDQFVRDRYIIFINPALHLPTS